jgi:hypothetical protein
MNINLNIDKETVGLGSVDNTSDIDKPVSVPQQSALDLKVDKTDGVPAITDNNTLINYLTNDNNWSGINFHKCDTSSLGANAGVGGQMYYSIVNNTPYLYACVGGQVWVRTNLSMSSVDPGFLQETTDYNARVTGDGGEVIDLNAVNSYYQNEINENRLTNLRLMFFGQGGLKRDGSDLVNKIYDLSSDLNDCTQSNAALQPTFLTNQRNGRPAYNFNSKWLQAATPVTNSTALTICAWINLNAVPATGVRYAICGKRGSPGVNTNVGFRFTVFEGRLEFAIYGGSSFSSNVLLNTANTWVHVAVVVNGTSVTAYVSGSQIFSNNSTNPIATSNRPLRIGAQNGYDDAAEHIANMKIENLMIYNVALTQQQVQSIMDL